MLEAEQLGVALTQLAQGGGDLGRKVQDATAALGLRAGLDGAVAVHDHPCALDADAGHLGCQVDGRPAQPEHLRPTQAVEREQPARGEVVRRLGR